MMNFLNKFYTYWCVFVFCLPVVLFYPFASFLSKKPIRRKYVSVLEKLWARFYFLFTGIYYQIEYQYKPQKDKHYIYCANHTSMLDIVTMGLVARGIFVFIGKAELLRVPIFGKIFGTFHIPVNRNSALSAYKALKQSEAVLDKAYSLIVFPEGGIFSQHPPQMAPFKEGAFRLAIEKKVPIIPVTILHNWILLPDDSKNMLELRSHWRSSAKVVVHQLIETENLTLADIDWLKEQTYQVIQAELLKYFPLTKEKVA